MTAGSKDYIYVSGVDTSFSTHLNTTILQPLSNMDNTDNTQQIVTNANSAGGTTGYTTKRTLIIGANQISNYIIIRGDLAIINESSQGASTAAGTAYVQITVDSVQKFEKTITQQQPYYVDDNAVWCYKYTPTSDEKTNGFTIDLDLKIVRGSSGGNSADVSAKNEYWEVWGA